MNILITGINGFVGSNLIRMLYDHMKRFNTIGVIKVVKIEYTLNIGS